MALLRSVIVSSPFQNQVTGSSARQRLGAQRVKHQGYFGKHRRKLSYVALGHGLQVGGPRCVACHRDGERAQQRIVAARAERDDLDVYVRTVSYSPQVGQLLVGDLRAAYLAAQDGLV